jgi:hypothetical protein
VSVGKRVGVSVGLLVGSSVGFKVGIGVGLRVGKAVGATVGFGDGGSVQSGDQVGAAEGSSVGWLVGAAVVPHGMNSAGAHGLAPKPSRFETVAEKGSESGRLPLGPYSQTDTLDFPSGHITEAQPMCVLHAQWSCVK